MCDLVAAGVLHYPEPVYFAFAFRKRGWRFIDRLAEETILRPAVSWSPSRKPSVAIYHLGGAMSPCHLLSFFFFFFFFFTFFPPSARAICCWSNDFEESLIGKRGRKRLSPWRNDYTRRTKEVQFVNWIFHICEFWTFWNILSSLQIISKYFLAININYF